MPQSLDKEIFLRIFPVPYETILRLDAYRERLIFWNDKMNLVAPSTISQIWVRHFLDSAQLMPLIPEEATSVADLGSGAGFPGLVLSILAKETKKNLHVFAIESTGKKAEFLATVAEELGLEVSVKRERIETIKNLKADIITARALTALPELLKYANRLIKKDSLCLFLKGRKATEELTEAEKYWTFNTTIHKSLSDESGKILVIKNLQYKRRSSVSLRR